MIFCAADTKTLSTDLASGRSKVGAGVLVVFVFEEGVAFFGAEDPVDNDQAERLRHEDISRFQRSLSFGCCVPRAGALGWYTSCLWRSFAR